MTKDTAWVIDSMHVKTPSHRTQIRSLSGGNQQKVIFGRWLLTKPEVLLLDEPTRGIDVGAKYEIYQLIINLANEGKGVIMVSSEMPELLGICNRIAVMSNGHLAGILDGETATQEDIMRLAAYRQHNPKIPANADCSSTGRLKRGYGVEAMLRLLSGNRTYHESHNAFFDTIDELEIMRLLEHHLMDYIQL